MSRARLLLLPLSLVWWIVTRLRSLLLGERGTRYDLPVVCVGNVTVGGTGKTPLVEALVRHFGRRCRVGVVSRGYGRRTSGQIVLQPGASASDVGDEPAQLKAKYPATDVVVDADREEAIEQCIDCGSELIVMDDGLQHLSVRPTVRILCCDARRPLRRDWPFPAGDLREGAHAAIARTDIVVVNKCPADLTPDQARQLRHDMRADRRPTFFTTIAYGDPGEELPGDTPMVCVAGVASPEPFFEEVRRRWPDTLCMPFADHHPYSKDDVERIRHALDERGARLITTEKDATRLPLPALTLPIEARFLFNGWEKFINLVVRHFD